MRTILTARLSIDWDEGVVWNLSGIRIYYMDIIIDWLDRAFVLGQLRLYYLLPAVLLLSIPAIIFAYLTYQKRLRYRIRYPIASTVSQIPKVSRIKRQSRHLPL
ncbi:MAG: hypothetical protein NTY09_09355, partial [bacterium]|nr:hypothetical protein [bacterium]